MHLDLLGSGDSGLASLKEVPLSSGFSHYFFLVWRGRGRTRIAGAVGFVFRGCLIGSVYRCDKRSNRLLMVCHRVRSQSFFSWRLHPKASLRASACHPASAQTADPRPSGTGIFCATILRSQARPNQTDVSCKFHFQGIHARPRTEQGSLGS